MSFSPETLIGELAATQPASIRVFQRYGIDFCCGGRRPLREVCDEQKLPYDEVAAALSAASTQPSDDRDWASERLTLLADHIVTRFHDVLRTELPRLGAMAAKVHQVHGAKVPEIFPRLNATLEELSQELISHMAKEEMILFPAIKELDAARAEGRAPQARFPLGSLSMPISVMEQEHDHAGELLSALREMTSGYQAPEWACNTFRGLYAGLRDLESDMHVHVHLENNILFPRAGDLERSFISANTN
jgi:regulator of cell morphogenesis and NO signaling